MIYWEEWELFYPLYPQAAHRARGGCEAEAGRNCDSSGATISKEMSDWSCDTQSDKQPSQKRGSNIEAEVKQQTANLSKRPEMKQRPEVAASEDKLASLSVFLPSSYKIGDSALNKDGEWVST